MCVIHVKRYIYPGGLPRAFESIQLCEHAHGNKPCASHTIRDSGVWTEMQSLPTPGSPAGSLIYDNLPSPASEGPPSTPVLATAGSVNYRLREPPSHRRTHSIREKGHRSFRRYFWDDAEIVIAQDDRGRGTFRRYHKRPHHKAHNSSDDVTVDGVGSQTTTFQAPTPPPAVPSDGFSYRYYPIPPPPSPRSHPRSSNQPEIPSTLTRKDKRRRETPVIIVPDLNNPPSKPSPTGANPATTDQGMPSSAEYSHTEPVSAHQQPTYNPSDDNEHKARMDARGQARRERRQRDTEAETEAETEARRKQKESERQLAEQAKKRQLAEDARKRQKEANEDYLAKLEQDRFAARDARRAAAQSQHARQTEEAQRRARAEVEIEAKANADYERRQREHARTRAEHERRDREERERLRQADTDAERERMRREWQEIEARKEREARREREHVERLQRELEWLKRAEDLRRNEREVDEDWDRRIREGRRYYRGNVDGPGFGSSSLSQRRSREMMDRYEGTQGGSSEARLREQGDRVLADARAKALAKDLQAKLGLRDDEDRWEDHGRGEYRR